MEKSQNIFDNQVFFESYVKLRQSANYNQLLEQPAMEALLPSLEGLSVLDIGCGWGDNCRAFAQAGARRVLGIDISERMLSLAESENSLPNIEYRLLDMSRLDELRETFDLVYSSLAFHYVSDFPKLMEDISSILPVGGTLLFSQEHPIVTATMGLQGRFLYNEEGKPWAYAFSDYFKSGLRTSRWFVDGVEDHHRTMGEIITAVARAGFKIDTLSEPCPTPEAIRRLPALEKELIKPAFLIIKAVKM